MGKYLALFGGLLAMILGVVLVAAFWWREFYQLIFGSIPILLFFGGLIALVAGISSIKDASRTKQLEAETEQTTDQPKPEAK